MERKIRRKFIPICHECANILNGRIKPVHVRDIIPNVENDFVAGSIIGYTLDGRPVKTFRASPSQERKCKECGEKSSILYIFIDEQMANSEYEEKVQRILSLNQ